MFKNLNLKKASPALLMPLFLIGVALVATVLWFVVTAIFPPGQTNPVCTQDDALTSQGLNFCSQPQSLKTNTHFVAGMTSRPEVRNMSGVQVYSLWSYDQQIEYLQAPFIVQKAQTFLPGIIFTFVAATILFVVYKIGKLVHRRWGIRNSIRTIFRKVNSLKKNPQPVN
jgi:hypothetical protein